MICLKYFPKEIEKIAFSLAHLPLGHMAMAYSTVSELGDSVKENKEKMHIDSADENEGKLQLPGTENAGLGKKIDSSRMTAQNKY